MDNVSLIAFSACIVVAWIAFRIAYAIVVRNVK